MRFSLDSNEKKETKWKKKSHCFRFMHCREYTRVYYVDLYIRDLLKRQKKLKT